MIYLTNDVDSAMRLPDEQHVKLIIDLWSEANPDAPLRECTQAEYNAMMKKIRMLDNEAVNKEI